MNILYESAYRIPIIKKIRYKEVYMTIIYKLILNLTVSNFIYSDHNMLIESKHALKNIACTTSFYIGLTHRY